MGAKRETELPAELKKARRDLDEWRGQRRHGQRIPEDLWDAAAQAVRKHGLNRVSRALGLDYYHLKKRSGQCPRVNESKPVFVELASGATDIGEPPTACVVELEKGNGVRMRICVRDAAAVDWSRIKEAFLGA